MNDVPFESDEPVQLGLENSLLVAVRTITFCGVFNISCRANAVALDALRAYLRHVAGPVAHGGKRGAVVMPRDGRLDHFHRLGIELSAFPHRPGAALTVRH